jgi:acyl-CoA thioester hydrolase
VAVNFDDLDAMGIVHHARYAFFVERATYRIWRGYGFDQQSPDAVHVVRTMNFEFCRPITEIGEINVDVWSLNVGQTSADLGFAVGSTDRRDIYARGRRVIVRLDPSTRRPTAWTPAARKVLTDMMHVE